MAISTMLSNAIEKRDLSEIYSCFYTILLSDPTFKKGVFDEAFNAVQSAKIEGFIQKYNGNTFKSESEWNEEYWGEVASELVDNFCMERINHLREVSRRIYSENIEDEEYINKKKQVHNTTRMGNKSILHNRKGVLILAVLILIIVLILVFLLPK